MKAAILAAVLVVAFGALALWLGDPGDDDEAPIARPRPRAVVLLTLDTTRADRLGCYGFSPGGESPTPVLDAIAAEGVLYPRAFAQAPLTLPSHASILTGLEPPQHGLRENEGFALPAKAARDFRTLTEILADAGYDTGAFVSGQTLDRRFGLDVAFDVYDDVTGSSPGRVALADRPADATTDRALAWLAERGDAPFFLWVHYFDPHHPFVPHPDLGPIGAHLSPYEAEIAFMDRELGRVVAALREAGRWDDALVIVVGDHGEGLGEHGEVTHGYLVHDATIRVPLIVKPHAACPDRPIVRPASTLDVAPTVLACGFDARIEGAQGRDLFSPASPRAYAETMYPFRQLGWSAPRAYREGEEKIVVSGGRVELFDLAADPGELRDLAATRPDRARELAQALRRYRAALEPRFASGADRATPSPIATSAYLSAEAPDLPAEPDDALDARLPRPADRMTFVTHLDDLRHELEHLDADGSAAAFARVQALQRRVAEAADEGNPAAAFWSGRARVALAAREGDVALPHRYRVEALEEALADFARYRALRPRDPRGWDLAHLARFELHALGVDGALRDLIAATEEQRRSGLMGGLGHALAGRARRAAGDLEGAREDYLRAVALEPERAAFRADLEAVERELGVR